MIKKYTVEIVDGIAVTRFAANPEVQDFISAYKEVARLRKISRRIWDLSNGAHLTNSELKTLGQIGKELFAEPARVAVIAPQDLTFGLAQIHERHRAKEGYHTRTFRSEEEALEWLQSED